jgi:NADH:ubiquinone oxidoreductase subunit 6 (subunit J)
MANKLYYFLRLLLTLCAICVIVANNTVFSLLLLILSFLSASVVLTLLGADFTITLVPSGQVNTIFLEKNENKEINLQHG